ncbi:MAG: transposase [Ignavibacteria bacterium]
MEIKEFYRRIYPHFQLDNEYYFVTSRLIDSIPAFKLTELRNNFRKDENLLKKLYTKEKYKEERYNLLKKYFGYYDDCLNRSLSQVNYLSDERIAKIVSDSFRFLNGRVFDMISFCIMPNHFHILIKIGKLLKPFYRIMQSLKRHTSRQSNIVLNKSGTFWEEESYDHIVRDEIELLRIMKYILNDPVKAGLVKNAFDWKWSYNKYFKPFDGF